MIGERLTGNSGTTYTIVDEIGRGGFGTVYRAEGPERRSYAVKSVVPVDDPVVQRSFEQEVRSTLGLAHENVLPVLDYGVCRVGQSNAFFVVSEYCANGDYASALEGYALQPPGLDKIVSDFGQILLGLSALHTKIVHRDLNPDFHFSFGSANHRVASDAFIDAGWKALKALRRSTPNG